MTKAKPLTLRQREASYLREKGMVFMEIAKVMNISKTAAWSLVDRNSYKTKYRRTPTGRIINNRAARKRYWGQ